MVQSIPSRDPENSDSLAGVFKEVLKKFAQRTDDMLPAIVETYDRAANIARVRPLIQVVTTEGDLVSRAAIQSVPVLQLGGGGFLISFPLVAGDLGWIKASDRDLSLFRQNFSEAAPNTKRMHSFEDAIFIPDIMKDYSIAGEDSSGLVIQYKDNTVKIVVKSNEVVIKAPTISLQGDLDVAGSVTASGDVTSEGTVTGEAQVVAGVAPNTVSLTTHVHTSASPGVPTSAPTPGT